MENRIRTESRGEVKSRARSVALLCVMVYLATMVGLLIAIMHRDDRTFTYTLDDPYIHLALAQGLAHGHYEINMGEASSPSSSIVWPFFLAPFAERVWGLYLPLGLNVLFCGTAAWLIGRIVDGWFGGWFGRFAVAIALMLTANLAGLTFVGMEHGLQVLLAIACAAGMAEAYAGRKIPAWCVAAAMLGPMVRYENFALTAAVAVALYGLGQAGGRGRGAARLVGASLVGPALFSLFLVSRGLPALPTSVLVKGRVFAIAGSGAISVVRSILHVVRSTYWDPWVGTMREPAWWGQLAVAALLVWLIARERERTRRFVLGGALLAAGLQLAIGRVNWFHRYEVYAMIFTALVVSTALVESVRVRWQYLAMGLVALAWPYEQAVWETPQAASNVYQQQYQMGRFEADYYRGAVAVNDLGSVSYRRPRGVYVLDLWGLASPEASRQMNKDIDWLDTITTAHGAGLAMIYPDWYPEGAPDDWKPLATMCITGELVSAAHGCVVFYSTGVGDQTALAAEVAAFARTLPRSVKMTLGRDSTDDDE